MAYKYYFDYECEQIFSYSELKEIHSDLVKYGDTDILNYDDYLKECTTNGFLFGAEKFEISDILKVVTSDKAKFKAVCNKDVNIFLTTWKDIYTDKGIYVTSTDNEDYTEELTKFFENL